MTEHPDYATYLSGADQETLDQMQRATATTPSKSSTWAQARELFHDSNPADGYWDNLSGYSRKKWFDKARAEQAIRSRVAASTERADLAEATVRAVASAVAELEKIAEAFVGLPQSGSAMAIRAAGHADALGVALHRVRTALSPTPEVAPKSDPDTPTIFLYPDATPDWPSLPVVTIGEPADSCDDRCTGCGGSGWATPLGEPRREDDSCSDCNGTGIEYGEAPR